jgi:FolB domain-containing protein
LDWITLDTFRIDCILGVLPKEQVAPQPLLLTIRLAVPMDRAADDDDLVATVNYAHVMDEAIFLFEAGRFRLLETMGVTLCRWLLADPLPVEGRAPIDAVEVTLRKPEILDGRAIPGISMRRDRPWLDPRRELWEPRVVVNNLQQNRELRADRVALHGGWTLPSHAQARLCAGTATCNGMPVPVGARVSSGELHSEGASVWLVVQRSG